MSCSATVSTAWDYACTNEYSSTDFPNTQFPMFGLPRDMSSFRGTRAPYTACQTTVIFSVLHYTGTLLHKTAAPERQTSVTARYLLAQKVIEKNSVPLRSVKVSDECS